MRLILAIRAFFAILFGLALPDELIERALLQSGKGTADDRPRAELAPPPVEVKPEPPKPAEVKPAEVKPAEVKAAEMKPAEVKRAGPSPEAVAVRALGIFQSEGRLLDFLLEEIDGYADAEIGAAVREIHRGCKRALHDHFEVLPVRTEAEESMVTVPEGYDPAEIRLVGNVVGRPPFSGTLKHKGWRVEEVRLPHIPEGKGAKVISPAEVELS